MLSIDASYLYELGKAIQPLHEITDNDTYKEVWFKSFQARSALLEFITRSVYVDSLQIAREPAQALIEILNPLADKYPNDERKDRVISWADKYNLNKAFGIFEAVFKAELKNVNLFLVTPKGGFDIKKMIFVGESLLPSSLTAKVPHAIADVREGTKCMAFELYTAAAFHLHRANESVMLSYFDILSCGKARPDNRNMGAYIKALEENGAPKVITSCLRDLKDMHRNPLMHPDQSIDSPDDAIALLNSIYTAVTAMLKQIPDSLPHVPAAQ